MKTSRINVELIAETDKALLLKEVSKSKQSWVPKKAILFRYHLDKVGELGEVEMETWKYESIFSEKKPRRNT